MILDTSAVVAFLFGEDEAERYEQAIADAPLRGMSVVSFLEAAIVIESRIGPQGGIELDAFIDEAAIELVPMTPDHAHAARQAW